MEQNSIHEKGFDLGQFNAVKVGAKRLEDATLNLSSLEKHNRILGNKTGIYRALGQQDIPTQREISNYFYRTNGIYRRVCNYFATMYRYDWYIVPEVYDEKSKSEKIKKEFFKILNYLDNSYVKKLCSDISLAVIKDGAYYGYIMPNTSELTLQDLPIGYCRSRYNVGTMPAVEFNMRFFDEKFPDVNYRMRVLKLFPQEIQKGYALYKQGKLTPDCATDGSLSGWYLLTPGSTVKFSLGQGMNDAPLFVNAIPSIIDLDAAQELDRRKQMQKLLKILIQELPRDKNGDLIFDVDEARDIHNNAVQMLSRAIGVDVLTTFTDVKAIDLSDKNTATSTDDLEKVERSVYNAFGTAQNLFNPEGNLSLEKSILNDEASIRSLILQFQIFFDKVAQVYTKSKQYKFRFYMLNTTQYNYKDLAKQYKEHAQMGNSKMLAQIALGHSQSSILNTAYFENEILHLSEIMIPPLISSTLSGEDILGRREQSGSSEKQNITETKEAGRPEKPDDEKSEKTIANKESMS